MSGDPWVSFPDIAKILSEILGKKVPFIPISDQEFLDLKLSDGLPDFVTKFMLRWVQGMGDGDGRIRAATWRNSSATNPRR